MSNIHIGLQDIISTIDHSKSLSVDIGKLFLQDELSDVTLDVNGHKFHAHKIVLASRSQYFRALLFGGLRESHENEVYIKGATLPAFKILLRYIYTGTMNLSSIKDDVVLDILSLAHQYGFESLQTAVSEYLIGNLTPSNVCVIYELATLYQLSNLVPVCDEYIDRFASSITSQESFYCLSATSLQSIIKRDSFCASEIQIFQGVKEWIERNTDTPEETIQDILGLIRLPLICMSDLFSIVRPSSLINADAMLDAMQSIHKGKDTDLQYRGYLMPEENVAVASKDAIVLQGDPRSSLLDGNVSRYDMDRGFTRHLIDDAHDQGIIIQLGRQSIINHMKMLLWDKDTRSYSYYIEVSMDQNNWHRVVDYSNYYCRSWQYIYFPQRVVRYIKVVGTHNTVNRVFHVVALEAYYVNHNVKLYKGLIDPVENVALVSKSATVIEGVSRAPNNVLGGNLEHYDWDSGYTCHQLGSGAICIKLGQPYWLSSCKLLLWDCDARSYGYYIETSVNNREWEVAVDKRKEQCRSWQVINFTPRPVVFFRITGTFNTVNEVFHLVHFECPVFSQGASNQ